MEAGYESINQLKGQFDIARSRTGKFYSQMEARHPDRLRAGVIGVNQLLAQKSTQAVEAPALATFAGRPGGSALGIGSYDHAVGYYVNQRRHVDSQTQGGNYISMQSRNDDHSGLRKGLTVQQSRAYGANEKKLTAADTAAPKTAEAKAGLTNSKSIDNLAGDAIMANRKIFIGQLNMGQFKNKAGRIQGQETLNNHALARNNSTLATRQGASHLPQFAKRVARQSVPPRGGESAARGSNIDIKDLAEIEPPQSNGVTNIQLKSRLAAHKLYDSVNQSRNDEGPKAQAPKAQAAKANAAAAQAKIIKQLYYGYQYDSHSSIREALHGTPQDLTRTSFNKRRTIKQLQQDMKELESLAPRSQPAQASDPGHEDYNPLRQDPAAALSNKLNNQYSSIANGSILKNEMAASATSLGSDNQADATKKENAQALREAMGAGALGQDAQNFGTSNQQEAQYEQAKSLNTNLFSGAINKISQVYGMNQDCITVEPYQPVTLQIPPIHSKFYKVPVQGKKAPAVLEMYFPASRAADFQVYWSVTKRYPCEGADECDGGFVGGEKTMYMSPYGEGSFSREHLFIGIYSRTGFQATFAVGFGRNCEGSLRQLLVAGTDPKAANLPRKARAFQLDDATSGMSDEGYQELVGSPEHISKADKLKLWRMQTKKQVRKLMNNDMERNVYFNYCNDLKNQASAGNPAVKRQEEQETKALQSSSQALATLFAGRPGSPTFSDGFRGLQTINAPFDQSYLMQSKLEPKEVQYVTEKAYFKRKESRLKGQEQERENQMLEQYKYNVFLTIKQKVLKQVKDQCVDEKVAILRKIKLARSHVIYIKLVAKIKALWLRIEQRRAEITQTNLRKLKSFRLMIHYRKHLSQQAPDLPPDSDLEASFQEDSEDYDQIVEAISMKRLNTLKRQRTNIQSLHHGRYLKPAFRLLVMLQNKHGDGYLQYKQMIRGFLYEMSKKNQIKVFFRVTTETISTFQKLIRSYFTKKRLWEVMIRRQIEDEIPKLLDFIRQMKSGRDQYEWLLEEVKELGQEEGKRYIDIISKKMVQYLKDVHVLNVYRFNCQVLNKAVKEDTLEGCQKFIVKSKKEFFDCYRDDLQKYPSRLVLDANVKTKDTEDKKKKTKKEKLSEDLSATAGSGMAPAAMFASLAQAVVVQAAGGERVVSLKEIEAVYAETQTRLIPYLPGKTGSLLFDVPHPTINVKDNISYFLKVPGTLMRANGQILQTKGKAKTQVYDVSQFKELIFYSIIESKRVKEAEAQALRAKAMAELVAGE